MWTESLKGIPATGPGWYSCCGVGIYVHNIFDLSGCAAAATWSLTRNTLFIPLARPAIKTWRIGFLLSQTVIHVPVYVYVYVYLYVCVCVCVDSNPNTCWCVFILSISVVAVHKQTLHTSKESQNKTKISSNFPP